MTNEEKSFQIQKEINNDKDKYETIADEAYYGAMMMAQWKDEQARKLRAERMKANNLSSSIQTISNLLEWLYARYPNVYCECNTQIRYYQKELRDKLDKKLNNEEK